MNWTPLSLSRCSPVNDVEVEMALRHQKEERGDAYLTCDCTDVIKNSRSRNGVAGHQKAKKPGFSLGGQCFRNPQSDTRSNPVKKFREIIQSLVNRLHNRSLNNTTL